MPGLAKARPEPVRNFFKDLFRMPPPAAPAFIEPEGGRERNMGASEHSGPVPLFVILNRMLPAL